jgi:catechol 2,3-dioxygenase-like lactoylglutathione lyase family enzyme
VSFTMSGFNHVGITVGDLDATLEWYERVFGVKPERIDHNDYEILGTMVRLPGAENRLAFVTVGGTRIGLSEYLNPKGKPFDLDNCDVGATHCCLETDDIHAAYESMTADGVEFSAPPFEAAPGVWYTYFRDCNGIQFELLQP